MTAFKLQRVGILVGSALLAALTSCAQPLDQAVLVRYQCPGDVQFDVVPVPLRNAVVLTLGDQSWELPHMPAASGAQYSDGRYIFWSKGENALIELADGERYTDCRAGAEHQGP